jgi:hypothetical protein
MCRAATFGVISVACASRLHFVRASFANTISWALASERGKLREMREQRGTYVVCALSLLIALFGLDACGSFNEPAPALLPDGAPIGSGAGPGAGGAGPGGRNGQGGTGVFAGSGGCPGYTCFDCASGKAVPATCETGRLCPEGYVLDCGTGGTGTLGTGGSSGRGGGAGSAGRGGTSGAGMDSGRDGSMASGGSAGTNGASGGSGTGGDDSGAPDSSAGSGADDAGSD